jgi:hypothetical protein
MNGLMLNLVDEWRQIVLHHGSEQNFDALKGPIKKPHCLNGGA